MKTYTYLLILLTIITLYNCKEETKKQKKTIAKIVKDTIVKKEEKKIEKKWDSLNRNNTKDFFIAYGKQNKENKVLIKTKFGNIKLRLFEDTPLHRASFIFLTKIRYFNTTVFHRIARDMAIQGGESDFKISADIRNKYKNYFLPPEIKKNKKHKYGTLAIAREVENNPEKNSNPFNFYIISSKYGASHLDGEYTIFGEVISGFSAIKEISKVKTTSDEWPIVDIPMTVEIIE